MCRAVAFDGEPLRTTVGQPVVVVLNSSDATHDLVVDELDFHVAADGGETSRAVLPADQPGTYTAYCTVPGHRQAGMETTVTIETA